MRISRWVSSALSFLYYGAGGFLFGRLLPVAKSWVDAATSGMRQIDGDQVGERLVLPSTLVTMIDATARQRHIIIRDRGRRGRLHLSCCRSGKLWIDEEWEPKGCWDGTGCLESVGGCGSGLVLNGQECWLRDGSGGCAEMVVWEWVGDGLESKQVDGQRWWQWW